MRKIEYFIDQYETSFDLLKSTTHTLRIDIIYYFLLLFTPHNVTFFLLRSASVYRHTPETEMKGEKSCLLRIKKGFELPDMIKTVSCKLFVYHNLYRRILREAFLKTNKLGDTILSACEIILSTS